MPLWRRNVNTALVRAADRRTLLRPLLTGALALVLVFAFIKLAGEILEGDTHAFDTRVLHAAHDMRARLSWLSEVMRDLSGLGSTVVLALATATAVGYLALVSRPITALLVAASALLGSAFVTLFKLGFGRTRPEAALAEWAASGLSFPSGHASMSAIVFLTIGTLVAGTHSRAAERVYILSTAALLTLLVGLSRVALGVHWATDVVGGWALGAAWALMWLLVARRLDSKGAVDRPSTRAP
jgi:undecaprenyl-diphosphatase